MAKSDCVINTTTTYRNSRSQVTLKPHSSAALKEEDVDAYTTTPLRPSELTLEKKSASTCSIRQARKSYKDSGARYERVMNGKQDSLNKKKLHQIRE